MHRRRKESHGWRGLLRSGRVVGSREDGDSSIATGYRAGAVACTNLGGFGHCEWPSVLDVGGWSGWSNPCADRGSGACGRIEQDGADGARWLARRVLLRTCLTESLIIWHTTHNKIQLEVVPPCVHHLNGHAEEMVHSQTKGMRVRLPSLKGVDVKGVPVRDYYDYERYWVFANEHMIQCQNNSNYSSLEQLHGHPIAPRQAFFNDPGIKPVPIRAFGELCYVIMQKDKRQRKLHDTAERCRYLCESRTDYRVLATRRKTHTAKSASGPAKTASEPQMPGRGLNQKTVAKCGVL